MPTLLIKNARFLVTMDEQRREVEGGDLLARDGVITEIGVGPDHPADTVVDAAGCVVTPGLVTTPASSLRITICFRRVELAEIVRRAGLLTKKAAGLMA